MKKNSTWILVADAARARAFRPRKTRTILDEIETRLDPAWEHQLVGPRLASAAIASDRPGGTFDRSGEGRHAKEPPTDPARYEKERFAREVARRLDGERKRRAFDELIVVAPPQFLGDLRAAMTGQLEDCVTAEVNKDLSKLEPAEILARLEDVL